MWAGTGGSGGIDTVKSYIGSIVVVVLLVLAIIFNASMSKMLAKMLIDPITNLVTASEKIASGDFEIAYL